MRLLKPLTNHERKIALVASGGGGKGGGSSHVAKEDPDTLTSRSEARVKEILSEGEVAGLVNGMKSIALDGTPVQDAGGTFNFKNFNFYILPGTQDQSFIPGFDADENSIPIGVRLKQSTAWTRRISDAEVNSARVDIRFPRMVKQDKQTGDTHGTKVNLKIELQSNNGGYTKIVDDTIKGKATSPYIRTYRVDLAGSPPWDIRVTRLTADSTSEALADQTWIDSFTEVIWGKLRHPNTVMAGFSIDAEQFGSIPTRAYEMYGVIIQVPTNYDPVARTYATTGPGTSNGTWDGTFKVAWTNNAAWCWYAMHTNKRWGFGRWIDASKVNKWAVYAAAQVCDEPVSDGNGGFEPRYTCALYLQQAAPAIQVMRDMASIFRAMVYYSGGLLTPVQDNPEPTVAHHFSLENIIGGKFERNRASRSARHTAANVAYSNMDNFAKTDYVYVEDRAAIIKPPGRIVTAQITALGCTSRAQAYRMGRWLLLSEKLDRLISFKTGQQGMRLRPGDVIDTHDSYRTFERLSGLVKSATANTVTLDKGVTLVAGETCWISTLNSKGEAERHQVTNAAGSNVTVINVTPNFTDIPQAETVWILVTGHAAPERWKIISVIPQDAATVQITALPYDSTKFDTIDIDPNFDADTAQSNAPSPTFVKAPGAITVEAGAANLPQGVQRILEISCGPSDDRFARGYLFSYRINEGNWVHLSESPVNHATINFVSPGLYEFQARTINTLGFKSAPVSQEYEIDETNFYVLSKITGLELVGQGNDQIFRQRDVKLAWRINSPAQYIEIGEEDANGIGGILQDPFFAGYVMSMLNGDTRQKIWPTDDSGVIQDNSFVFTEEMNAEANKPGKPIRRLRARIQILDKFNNLSPPTELPISNPVPDAPKGVSLQATFTSVDIGIDAPTDADAAGIKIVRSPTSGFAVTDADAVVVYEGPDYRKTIPQDSGTKFYYRVAIYDTFGAEITELNFSPEVVGQTLTLTPDLPPPSIDPPPPGNSFTTTQDVTVVAAAGEVIRVVQNGGQVLSTSPEWPKDGSGNYIALTLSQTTVLRWRGYFPDGSFTQQGEATFTKTGQGATCANVSAHEDSRDVHGNVTLSLSCATAAVTIKKSNDGITYGTNYTAPFVIAPDVTVWFKATKAGLQDSSPGSYTNSYTEGGGKPERGGGA